MALGFSIPGTIKNEYLPFRVTPGTGPQTFSFRNRGSSAAQLNICPASLRDPAFGSYFGMDIGNQLAYGAKATEGSTSQVTLDDIFNNIPAIQIREFLPDTKLDQCLNFFGNLVSQLLQKTTGGKSTKELIKTATGMNPDVSANKSTGSWLQNAGKSIQELIEKIFNWIENDLPQIGSAVASLAGGAAGSDDQKALQFPYLLYYRLQTCTTTNYYELPCISEKNIVSSDGSPGWDGMNHFGVSLGNGSGIMNKVLKFLTGSIFNNIRVNFMPYWNAEKGWETREDDVTIQFDLFNDTEASAIANFIFVNTIVPGARWLQYGMFQHSPNLYDIKLEGINRLFACTGQFSVKYGGQLRTPPETLVSKLNNKYGSGNSDNRIKIPDVYHVELKFKSILPKNFNTYIYQYSNTNEIFTSSDDEGLYSKLSDKIKQGVDEISA